MQSLGGTKFQPSDSMQEVTFIAAWGHVAHLQQEKGMSKRQEVAKSLTTGIRENAVASPIPCVFDHFARPNVCSSQHLGGAAILP